MAPIKAAALIIKQLTMKVVSIILIHLLAVPGILSQGVLQSSIGGPSRDQHGSGSGCGCFFYDHHLTACQEESPLWVWVLCRWARLSALAVGGNRCQLLAFLSLVLGSIVVFPRLCVVFGILVWQLFL